MEPTNGRPIRRRPARFLAALLALGLAAAAPAAAGGRDLLICKPGAPGDPEDAADYLKNLTHLIEGAAGWKKGSMKAEYRPEIEKCRSFIKDKKPGFGLLSLGFFLETRGDNDLEPLLQVIPADSRHEESYYLLVRKGGSYTSLEDLRGKRVSSNLFFEEPFVDRVVFAGKINAGSYFDRELTFRPLRAIKGVIDGRLDGVLLDARQVKALERLPFSKELTVVYTSPPFPPPVLAAFSDRTKPQTAAEMKEAFKKLPESEDGRSVLDDLQITSMEDFSADLYTQVLNRYSSDVAGSGE